MSIYCVESVKGGCGKSILCRFLIDHFIELKQRPFVIDTDNCNPDIARSYSNPDGSGKLCDLVAYDPQFPSGQRLIINSAIDAVKDKRIVIINRGAKDKQSAIEFAPGLASLCEDNNCDFVVLWVLDVDLFCVEQMRDYLKLMPSNVKIVAIKNLHMSLEEDISRFKFYDESITGKRVASCTFPRLHEYVIDLLKTPKCLAVHEIYENLSEADRYLARGRITMAKQAISDIISAARPPLSSIQES